jgi:hypothetical protein
MHFGFHGDRWKLINTHGHQSTALPCPSPLLISGAKYSWVPTNDIERALVGSAISSGSGLTWFPISFLGFRSGILHCSSSSFTLLLSPFFFFFNRGWPATPRPWGWLGHHQTGRHPLWVDLPPSRFFFFFFFFFFFLSLTGGGPG